jgi:HK97 family phage prohead protease
MQIEKLEFQFEVKQLGGEGEMEGWASTYDLDLGKDKVLPGAFTTTLRKTKGEIPMLFNHDRNQIVGVGKSASEDQRGLYVRAKLAMGTQLGREVHELMTMGALKGLSIGYSVPEKGFVMDGGVRLLKQIDLHEYSATPFPMNPSAVVNRVKCLGEMTAREVEDQLRDVFGLTAKEAKRAIAEGFKTLLTEKRDVDPEEQEREDESIRRALKAMHDDFDAKAFLSSIAA